MRSSRFEVNAYQSTVLSCFSALHKQPKLKEELRCRRLKTGSPMPFREGFDTIEQNFDSTNNQARTAGKKPNQQEYAPYQSHSLQFGRHSKSASSYLGTTFRHHQACHERVLLFHLSLDRVGVIRKTPTMFRSLFFGVWGHSDM